jgi:tetratricopeptide (TPR) repeat protein
MKKSVGLAISVGCLACGIVIGIGASKEKPPGLDNMRGRPPAEAGAAALQEAERLAGKGTWELLGVARVYYLSGDKTKGQALIDKVLSEKVNGSDWQRIGQIYADAGENAKAESYFQKVLAADPKDDTGQAEIGAWYIHIGQREKGEELLGKAIARHPDEVWHYVRAGEGYLGVSPR